MDNQAGPVMAFALLMIAIAGCGGKWSAGEAAPPLPEYPPIQAGVTAALKAQLETLARSPEPLERAHAALLLGSAGEQAEAAVPYLVVALEDPDRTVRADAAEALGQIGAPRAVEPLIAIIEDGDEDWGVRARAARSLGKLDDRRATAPLVAALADMVSHVRLMAATALGEIGDPAAEAALQSTALHDSDLNVRYAAKEALEQIRRDASADETPVASAEK
jgi:HEAT repeat protein